MTATLVYNHTEQTKWARLTSSKTTWFDVDNASLSDPGDYVHMQPVWTTNMNPGSGKAGRVVLTGLPEGGSIAWKFYSSDTSGGDTAEARIWGISKLYDALADPTTDHLADYLCKLEIETGGTDIGTSSILPAGNFADEVTILEDRTHLPGGRIVSQDADTAAELVFDAFGYWGYIVEITAKTPNTTNWGALYRVF